MVKSDLLNYINANIIENDTGSITATKLKTVVTENVKNLLPINEEVVLTDEEKNNVLSSLGIADEKINLTIKCESAAAILNTAVVTVTYNGKSKDYTWTGSTLVITIPTMYEYTFKFSNNIKGYNAPESFTNTAKRNRIRNITVVYDAASYVDLSYRDTSGNVEDLQETANCYVIKEAGKYCFPIVYGCAIKGNTLNDGAYTQVEGTYTKPFYNYLNNQITSPYIETDTGIDAESVEVISIDNTGYTITDAYLVRRNICKYVYFEVGEVPALGGNAIIAVKDGDGQIMWSWHIWAYPGEIYAIDYTNSNNVVYGWMNVDLGWVKAADGSTYGDCPYYQWGRKDPLMRNYGVNQILGGVNINVSDIATSVASSIQNPQTFYKHTINGTDASTSVNYNWWYDNGTAVNFYNYWDASTSTAGISDNSVYKTVYDPCPRGWHVPNGNSFKGVTLSNIEGSWTNGFTWNGRFFYAVGYRHRLSGSVNTCGSERNAWYSSSNSATGADSMYFSSSAVGAQNTSNRARGFVLCPVRE